MSVNRLTQCQWFDRSPSPQRDAAAIAFVTPIHELRAWLLDRLGVV
jgi:hypothetical protein